MTIFIFNLNDRSLGVIESNNKKIYLRSSMLLGFLKNSVKIQSSSPLNLKRSSLMLIACLYFTKTCTFLIYILSRSLPVLVGILLENYVVAYLFDKFFYLCSSYMKYKCGYMIFCLRKRSQQMCSAFRTEGERISLCGAWRMFISSSWVSTSINLCQM